MGGKAKKRAQHVQQQLIEKIEYLMEFGTPKTDIVRVMYEDARMPLRTVEWYMKKVRDAWAARASEEAPIRRERARARNYRRLRRIEKRQEDSKADDQRRDDKLALAVEWLIAELEGTLEPEKIEIIKRVGWEDLTPEQIDAIIAAKGKLPEGVTVEQLFAAK